MFRIMEDNTVIRTERDSGNADRTRTTFGSIAELSTAASWPDRQPALGPWDPVKRQADLAPAYDAVAEMTRIETKIIEKWGTHTLPHRPEPGEIDRFLAQWPEVYGQARTDQAGTTRVLVRSRHRELSKVRLGCRYCSSSI